MFKLTFWNGKRKKDSVFLVHVVRNYVATCKGIYAQLLDYEWYYIGIGLFLYNVEKII